ncbi:AAA family ATPase [Leptospira yasudae]|uniref:ATP-binding protein n=1 Tax=Leptospira yasudae TaxID=2202201 RepID=UPI001C4F1191|nr:AAA family ATPase [Leptospira yasudae]MBW0432704.1 AAA family ATPase [Leptospira yasudae]
MISALQLLKFGKFEKAEFTLSESVTIFHGKNESGKTTIFDALRLAIGSKFLTASQEPKKSILSRYGEKSLDGYKVLGEVPELSKDAAPQYVHCVSLREGELEFAFHNDKIIKPDFLRSKLLNNGVNLEGISSSLNKIHSPKKGSAPANAFDKLKEEIAKLKSGRIELVTNIETLHARNKTKVAQEERHNRDQSKELEIRKQLESIEKNAALDAKIQKKIKLVETLSEILRLKTAQETLNKNLLYSKDESSGFESFQKEIETSEKNLSASTTLLQDKQSAIDSKKREIESLRNQLGVSQKMKQKAEEWNERIDKVLREEGFTEEIRTSESNPAHRILGMILTGFGCFGWLGVIGSLVFAHLGVFEILSGSLISTSLVALGIYFLTRKKELVSVRYNSEKEKDFVLKISGQWNLTFPEYSIPLIEKIENLRQFFAKQIQNNEVKSHQIESLEKEIRTFSGDTDKIRDTIRLETEKIQNLTSKRNSWLNDRRASTIQEYHKLIAEFQAQTKSFSEGLKKILTDHGAKTLEDLEIRCKTAISTMEEIPTQFPNDPERHLRETKKKELEKELQGLNSELQKLNTAIQVEDALIQDSLPEKEKALIETIQSIAEKEIEFSRMESKRRSAKIAQDIVEEISKDQSMQFAFVASEIGKEINRMLPKREVSFEAIDKKESIKMKDQAGNLRSIDHLSGGTVATFYLIFKLFLARKTVPKNGILLLDEPFVHLDPGRIESALEYLKQFQKETDYQICFFTKQAELADIIAKSFPKSKKISLS